MELTRRDAIAALGALGIVGGAGAVAVRETVLDGAEDIPDDTTPGDRTVVDTMAATADVVYPSAVDSTEEFVETFVGGRLDDSEHAAGLRTAVGDLREATEGWYDRPYGELDVDSREEALRSVGADTAEEDPDGTLAERVRYYVVNDLLFALYTSPTGGELVGIENPQGHPGGTDTYRQGPP